MICQWIHNFKKICVVLSRSVMSNSLQHHGLCSPGSSVHEILQARILKWVAILFSRRSSQPRDWTQVSHIVGRFSYPLNYQGSPRILEWVDYSFSKASSQPRNWIGVSFWHWKHKKQGGSQKVRIFICNQSYHQLQIDCYISTGNFIQYFVIKHNGNNMHQFSSVQWLSSVQFFCNPMDCSTPGLPVHHQLLEFTQTRVHRVDDAIQSSHPLLSALPIFNLSQHQGLFKWVSSSHQVAKVLGIQLQHQSFQWIFRTDFL